MRDLHERMEEYLFREDWDPPDGRHTALIYGYKEGLSKKKKKAWWKLECRMLDQNPELAGKEFGICFHQAAPMDILKSAVSTLAGHKVETIQEAILTLMDSPGTTINIQTTTNEKSYTNHRILGVVTKAPKAPRVSQMPTKD